MEDLRDEGSERSEGASKVSLASVYAACEHGSGWVEQARKEGEID